MQDWVIRWGCFVCRLIKCPIICILLSCRGFFNNGDKHASNVRTLHQCINCGNATTDIISYTASSRKFHLQWPAPFFATKITFDRDEDGDYVETCSPWIHLGWGWRLDWSLSEAGGWAGGNCPRYFHPDQDQDPPLIAHWFQTECNIWLLLSMLEYAWAGVRSRQEIINNTQPVYPFDSKQHQRKVYR